MRLNAQPTQDIIRNKTFFCNKGEKTSDLLWEYVPLPASEVNAMTIAKYIIAKIRKY